MNIFVTGATGFIGSAVVRELHAAGHQVRGLARSESAASSLTAAGVEVQRGSLEDLDSLRRAAAASDGVIHLAYHHDFSEMQRAAQMDLNAVETIGAALASTSKPFVIPTGTAMLTFFLPPGQVGTEQDLAPAEIQMSRIVSEKAMLALAQRGVRASVIRLAPTVHGEGDHGFVAALIQIARAKGLSAYIGAGSNRWPAVHRLDAARLFRLALEHAPAGSMLHGAAEEGIPMRAIAEVIGRHLNLPVVSISPDQAGEHFGWLGTFLAIDNPASSALTRERLGWHPAQPGLIADLDQGHYFQNGATHA